MMVVHAGEPVVVASRMVEYTWYTAFAVVFAGVGGVPHHLLLPRRLVNW